MLSKSELPKQLQSFVDSNQLSLKERHRCLASLAFPEMDARQHNIEQPNETTCTWIFSDPSYKTWLGDEAQAVKGDLLWIKGKPGSGKSTLVKSMVSAHASPSKLAKHVMCLAFFFNARGAAMEKSPLGLYRSLLYQLLDQSDTVLQEFYPLFEQKHVLFGKKLRWESGQLSQLFHKAITTRLAKPVHVFVDALDECEDNEVREIVRNFERSAVTAEKDGISLRICWSSRHYPHIGINRGLEVRMEDRNASDTNVYIEQELCLPAGYKHTMLMERLVEKASGVFLWFVLVVRRLRKASDQGHNQSELENLLRRLPGRLEDYFAEILDAMDPADQDQRMDLTSLVLCAFRPLKVAEVYLALGMKPEPHPREWKEVNPLVLPSINELQRFERLVNNLSAGPFEVVPGADYYRGLRSKSLHPHSIVQVIHETVQDFLFEKGGREGSTPLYPAACQLPATTESQ